MYLRLQLVHLRVALEYPANFWIASVAMVLGEGSTLGFLWVLFSHVPSVADWRFDEVRLLYGLITLQAALGGFLCSGFWNIPHYVRSGQLDKVLVRPLAPLVQMAALHVDMRNLGRLAISLIVIGQALVELPIAWNVWRLAFLISTLLGSTLLFNALFLVPRCLVFWINSDTTQAADWLWNLIDFAKYPLSVYAWPIRLVLTGIVPFAFIAYYPAAVLLGKPLRPWWIGYATPFVGPAGAVYAWIIWRRGLARYQSAGH
jgi:ABC-2 type transport system permease protein